MFRRLFVTEWPSLSGWSRSPCWITGLCSCSTSEMHKSDKTRYQLYRRKIRIGFPLSLFFKIYFISSNWCHWKFTIIESIQFANRFLVSRCWRLWSLMNVSLDLGSSLELAQTPLKELHLVSSASNRTFTIFYFFCVKFPSGFSIFVLLHKKCNEHFLTLRMCTILRFYILLVA